MPRLGISRRGSMIRVGRRNCSSRHLSMVSLEAAREAAMAPMAVAMAAAAVAMAAAAVAMAAAATVAAAAAQMAAAD